MNLSKLLLFPGPFQTFHIQCADLRSTAVSIVLLCLYHNKVPNQRVPHYIADSRDVM